MKFMLLQDYGRVEGDVPPMSEWAPEDVEAHIKFQKDLNAELRERGELVEAQALTGAGRWRSSCRLRRRRAGRHRRAVPGVEGAARRLPDGRRRVEERALEIAAQASAAPGPDGVPIARRSRSAR